MLKRRSNVFILIFILISLENALIASESYEIFSSEMFDESYLLSPPALPTIKPSSGGALQIIEYNGIKTLGDKNGNPIQLRGMSTHGLQWFPEILNDNAFAALSNDWARM